MSTNFERKRYGPCRENGHGTQAALGAALGDKEHRMQHWVQQVSIVKTMPSHEHSQKMEALEKKKLNDLQREVRGPSRSPRGPRNRRTRAKAVTIPPQTAQRDQKKTCPWHLRQATAKVVKEPASSGSGGKKDSDIR